RLGDVAEVVGGATPSRTKSEYWGGDIPWVVPSELTNLPGRYLRTTRESITEIGRKAAGLRVIPPGSVLLTSRASIGSTAITTIPVVTNQGFQNLVAKKGTQGLWLFYCVSAQQRELLRRASGSTFREISRGSVRSLPIVIPPLPEQRAIAAVLDSIDEAIERTEAVITATEQLREAVREELLTRGLPGWHFEWKRVPRFGNVPADWELVRLGDIAKAIYTGKTPPRHNADLYGGCVPWVKPADLSNSRFVSTSEEFLTELGVSKAVLIPENTVLVSCIGTIGNVAIAKTQLCFNQQINALIPSGRVHSSFLYWSLLSLRRYMQAIAAKTAVPILNKREFSQIPFYLPSLPEQEAIARTLDSIDDTIETSRMTRIALAKVKVSTAEALLTGQRRVPVEVGK
ncbi:MAG: hypothetical protein F4Z07_01260, partial [Dehalococcoidia bacterium]|nr:hypothetical protein [Dehalococcoidia bacterium]